MDSKKMIMLILLIVGLIAAGFIAYKVYNLAIADATQRIKEGVSEGVTEGIGGAVNPLKFFRRGQ